ncbi:peroxiredoxin [Chitinimonas sp.]|uniref:peroxiredoxin n=1 Tax=Chitinimonas sp. TaxID=1934313 RepID=UPI0035B2AA1E
MLEPGIVAPDFELPDAAMDPVSLSDYRGQKIVVLYFYHRDNDPGCTREAIEFSDLADGYAKADAVVLGVSLDDPFCHEDFRDRHGLLVRLLSDTDTAVSRQYHTLREMERDGVVKLALIRSTFVVDYAGTLRHALYNVSPRGHAADVLQLVQQLHAEAREADVAASR